MLKNQAERRPVERILVTTRYVSGLIEEEPVHIGDFEAFVTQSFHKMFLVDDGYEPAPDQSLAALAASRNMTPAELAMDTLMANDGQGLLYFPLFNYSEGSLDVLHRLHQSPARNYPMADVPD